MPVATYAAQNLNAQLCVFAFQTRDESITLLIGQNRRQGPNSFGFIDRVGDVLP